MMNLSEFLSPAQAAQVLGVSTERVVQMARAGKMVAVNTALGRLFDPAEVERVLAERALPMPAHRFIPGRAKMPRDAS